MISRATVALALAGSAAAFAPMMSMDMGRREIVKIAGAGAVAAPLLRPNEAEAAGTGTGFLCGDFQCNQSVNRKSFPNTAPIITIMDHRGCKRGGANKEYKGALTNDQDDEMCVKVDSKVIPMSEKRAAEQLREAISFKSKGIDGDYTGSA